RHGFSHRTDTEPREEGHQRGLAYGCARVLVHDPERAVDCLDHVPRADRHPGVRLVLKSIDDWEGRGHPGIDGLPWDVFHARESGGYQHTRQAAFGERFHGWAEA